MAITKKKVLLICDSTTSFIVNAVKEGINNANFECITTDMTVNSLGEIKEKPQIIFLYVVENIDRNSEEIVYIRDFCIEGNRKLFLIGNKLDITEVLKVMPNDIIGGCFERPINPKLIGEQLNMMMDSYESGESKKHILVVDDSGNMLRIIREWLSDKYRVSVVNSAASAIAFLATNHPDLILLDYEMPVCSGPQMLQMIRSESVTSKVPVIFLTAKDDRESVQKVLSLRPDGYLLKSMSSEKIISAIDKFFESHKSDK